MLKCFVLLDGCFLQLLVVLEFVCGRVVVPVVLAAVVVVVVVAGGIANVFFGCCYCWFRESRMDIYERPLFFCGRLK